MILIGVLTQVNPLNKGSVEAWVPRSLILNGLDVQDAPCTFEGLSPLRFSWIDGRIESIEIITNSSTSSLKLLLPRLVEVHAHIDKAFSWNDFPNLIGTYQNALEANFKEHKKRTSLDVRDRGEKALTIAVRNGIRAIRSHVDSFGKVSNQNWETLLGLQRDWRHLIELQLVALVPLDFWSTDEGKMLANKVYSLGGSLGGVLVPPFNKRKSFQSLLNLLKLANQLGCEIDLHIDESQSYPAEGLNLLVDALDQITPDVAITCSHASSMALLSENKLRKLADRLADHKVNVIALPLTNAWLLGRYSSRQTPIKRPLAPINQLQKSGVTVAVGGDNVQDSWFPLGGLDPLALMAFSMPLAQLAPWSRLGLSPFTTAAARILGLDWDGTFAVGSPADFVLLDAGSWTDALSLNTKRLVIVNGEELNEEKLPTSN